MLKQFLFLALTYLVLPPLARAHDLPCSLLLENYRQQKAGALSPPSTKLVFASVGARDVYNPTKPFQILFKGQRIQVLAARVEARDSEVSTAMFFTENAGVWSPLVDAPAFAMQDPFFTFINGELIFGGVEIFPNSQGGYGYRTRFYRGRGLDSLESFAQGPDGMKDIRLVQLPGGKIGLFTRPQGRIAGTGVDAGRGKIGFSVIASLADLTLETINAAPLIENQFHPEEWGGVNEAQILSDGRLVALAHVARFDELGNRHYYSAVFTLDSASRQASPFEIILERSDLTGGLNGESKRKDLMDVVFSGGLELGKNHATVYVGAGDAEVHMKKIDLPNSLRPLPAK